MIKGKVDWKNGIMDLDAEGKPKHIVCDLLVITANVLRGLSDKSKTELERFYNMYVEALKNELEIDEEDE